LKLLPLIASLFIRTLHATLRRRHVDVHNIRDTPQYILSFWHAHLLLLLHARYRRPISVMISQSKDGEYIARVIERYGASVVRGSSTRGGTTALRELLREARAGKNIAFTPDGPKGPARIAKDGVVYAARATGLPIVPMAFAAQKKNSSARGTGWSSRCRSRKRCFCTERRSSCRVTATSRRGVSASSRR
jgi:lysophospholipid acyltransferase (LPLAT)-like uncharacterized protein